MGWIRKIYTILMSVLGEHAAEALLAGAMLDNAALKDLVGTKW